MITPIIEKYILNGKAQFRTLPIFYSPTARLKVPKNRFVIITDILFYPTVLLQSPDDEQQVVDILDRYSINQLDLFSHGSNRNSFLFRCNYEQLVDKDSHVYWKNSEPVHVNVLLLHRFDVYFSVLRFQGVAGAAAIFPSALATSQIPSKPISYGTSEQTLQQLVTDDGSDIQPNGQDETGLAGPSSTYRTDSTCQVNAKSIVPIPNSATYNRNHLMMNISYVEFNIETLKDFI